jgi:hypothetical protein
MSKTLATAKLQRASDCVAGAQICACGADKNAMCGKKYFKDLP